MRLNHLIRIVLLIGALHLPMGAARAQWEVDWQADFGGSSDDYLWDIQLASDGGYLLGGWSASNITGNKTNSGFGNNDYWLVKVDAKGNKLWERGFGGTGDDRLFSVRPTPDGGYLLGGASFSGISGNKTNASFGSFDYWLVKVNASGHRLWERVYGGDDIDVLFTIVPATDGGYILAGYSWSGITGNKTSANHGLYDYWLVKVDESGNKQWENSFGGNNVEVLYSLQATGDGGYILGGYSMSGISGNKTNASLGGTDYWLVKLDSSGNKQWERVFGGNLDDSLQSVRLTDDGGYLLGGYWPGGVSGDMTNTSFGANDYWLVKVDASGNKQWEKGFGGSVDDRMITMQSAADGGMLLAGYSASSISGNKTNSGFGNNDYWLVKVDEGGHKQWEKSFGGNGDDRLYACRLTSDGGCIMGGFSASGISGNKTVAGYGSYDAWVVKLKPSPPVLTALAFTNDIFTGRVSTLFGDLNVVIYAATNGADWTPIFTNPPVTGSFEFTDAPAAAQRFYRAALVP